MKFFQVLSKCKIPAGHTGKGLIRYCSIWSMCLLLWAPLAWAEDREGMSDSGVTELASRAVSEHGDYDFRDLDFSRME